MNRDTVTALLSLMLLCLLSVMTNLSRKIIMITWVVMMLVIYYFYSHLDLKDAKPLSSVKWKEGMIIITMRKDISRVPDLLSILRLSGFTYLHSSVVVSDGNQLKILELVNNRNYIKDSEIHNDINSLGIAQSYSIERYIEKMQKMDTFILRIYEPPKQLKSLSLKRELIKEILESNSLLSCKGFLYEYLVRCGMIPQKGNQLIPSFFRYTPVLFRKQLDESGWKYKLYTNS